jgi:hypothetical protein
MTTNDGRSSGNEPKAPPEHPRFTGMDSDPFRSQKDVDELVAMYEKARRSGRHT